MDPQTTAALVADVTRTLRDVPDFPKPGILFKDISTVLRDPSVFPRVCDWFAEVAQRHGATAVAGIESRGFLFAAPVAAKLGLPLALVRKPGKLPWKTRKCTYSLEYGTDCVEMHEDAVRPGERVLIIDDLLATGGTMGAAVQLTRELGAEVVAVAFAIELTFLPGREKLAGVPIEALVGF